MLINQRKKGEKKEKTDIWLFECVAANNLKQIVKRGTTKCLPHIAYMVQILIKGKQTFQCDLLRVGIIMIEKNHEVHQGTHVNGLNTRIHRNLFYEYGLLLFYQRKNPLGIATFLGQSDVSSFILCIHSKNIFSFHGSRKEMLLAFYKFS